MKAWFGSDLILHIPFWLAWIILMNAGDSNGFGFYSQKDHDILLPLIINTATNAIYAYGIALWLGPKFYRRRGSWKYLIIILVFTVTFLFLKTATEKVYIGQFITNLKSVSFWALLKENLITMPAFLAGGHVYWIYRRNRQERNWLTQEKLNRELELIKAQMSPHFIFNALNNLYSLGLQGNEKMVSKGILKLSGLLRYTIYESQVERLPLDKELNYIEDFIEVNKLMFPEDELGNIQFIVMGLTGGCHIAPMILITFVENAFKHGPKHGKDVHIDVKASLTENKLEFIVKNRIDCITSLTKESKYNGLGLSIVKKQLDIIYENRYTLVTKTLGDYYIAELQIEL